MQISGLNNQQTSFKTKHTATTFKSHKLLEVFPVPNYEKLKGFSYILGNKQKVVIIPKPGAPVSVNTVIKTGALNEKDSQRGISHFLEHLEFDGSRGIKPGGFDKIAESQGANINAHTGTDCTAYFFQVSGSTQKELSNLLGAHASMVKYPSLPPAQFKKEKEVVIKETNERQDDPQIKQWFGVIKKLFGIKSTTIDLPIGREENIRAISRKDVFDYHKTGYTPDNIETYIVGDVNHEQMIKLVDKFFDTKDFRPSTKPIKFEEIQPLEKTAVEFLSTPKSQASSIIIGLLGPKNSDEKGLVSTEALVSILGDNKSSRINKPLAKLDTEVDMGISSPSNHPSHPQMIYLGIDIEAGKEQASLDAIKQGFESLKTKPVTQKELNNTKKALLYQFKKDNETTEKMTETLEDFSTKGGLEAYKNRVTAIKSLTLDDINQAAANYLDPKKASVVILQPENKQNTNITFSGKKLINQKYITKKVLPNNLKLILNANPNVMFATSRLELSSAARPKPGVADVLAQMLDSSSAKYSEGKLSQKKADKNLQIEVVGTTSGIAIQTESEKENLPAALKLMKEIVFAPALTEKNFKKAKNNVKLQLDSLPIEAKERAIEEMYGDHPQGDSNRRIKEKLDNVTLDDVQKYYDALLKTSSAKAAVTGPIESGKDLKAAVQSEFENLGRTFAKKPVSIDDNIKPPTKTVVVAHAEKGKTQSDIYQLFHIPAENVKDTAALSVMNTILGGGLTARLFKDLREKQKLAYQAGSRFTNNLKASQQAFIIKTDIKTGDELNENMEKSLNGFKKHIDKMIRTSVTTEELTKAKRLLRSAYVSKVEKSSSQNKEILMKSSSKEGTDYYNQLAKAVNEVTPAEIKRVAKKYLSTPSVISTVTTEEAIQKNKALLEQQGELKVF